MKKLTVILSVLLLLISFTGCESEKLKQLKREVEENNDQCPIDMGFAGYLTEVEYDEDDQEVIYRFAMSQDLIDIGIHKQKESAMLDKMKLFLSRGDSKGLLSLLVETNTGLRFVYEDSMGDKIVDVALTPSELKELKNSPLSETEINEKLLESLLEAGNSVCPTDVDFCTKMIKIEDDGSNIIYSYLIDENVITASKIRSIEDSFKENIKTAFSDPAVQSEFSVYKSLGRGVIYRYIGDTSADSIDIVFASEEL